MKFHRVQYEEGQQELAQLKRQQEEMAAEQQRLVSQYKRETKQEIRQVRDRAETQAVRENLADSDSIELKLKEMGEELHAKTLDKYISRQQEVTKILGQVDIAVNNN